MVTPDPGPKFQNYEEVALWQGIDTAGQAPRIADHGSRLHNIYSNTNMLFILGQEKSMQTDSKEGIVVSRGNPPTWVLFLTLIMSTDRGRPGSGAMRRRRRPGAQGGRGPKFFST